MKALVVDGRWSPRPGYSPGADEVSARRALVGSAVWRDTRFEVKDVPVPVPRDDEVLIRVRSCGICGSDTHLYETDKDGYIRFSGLTRLPCILGHEFSGVVERAGGRVRGLREGDLVAAESVMWCGLCEMCRSGAPNQCSRVELMGLSSDGALSEFASVNERYCWRIDGLRERYPGDELFEAGALIEPIGCAYNGLFVAGRGFNPGSTVAVHGAGPIGLGAIALSRAAGAGVVIAFDENDGRVAAARAMGADYAFNVRKMDRGPGEKVMELTGGLGAEVQVEAAGAAPFTVPEMERSLASQGKIIYLGRASTTTAMNLDALVTGAGSVIGARGHAGYGIFPQIIRLISRGRLDVRPMISRVFPFSSVMEALKESSLRGGGKVIVNMPRP
jgi:threonine dehydrogenase-like Zn-dependent dehydrogenase